MRYKSNQKIIDQFKTLNLDDHNEAIKKLERTFLEAGFNPEKAFKEAQYYVKQLKKKY
jgi:uncharacterized Ntn-hydrolase superfamily protein